MKKSGVSDADVINLLRRKRAGADTDAILSAAIKKAENVTLGYFFTFPARRLIRNWSTSRLKKSPKTPRA